MYGVWGGGEGHAVLSSQQIVAQTLLHAPPHPLPESLTASIAAWSSSVMVVLSVLCVWFRWDFDVYGVCVSEGEGLGGKGAGGGGGGMLCCCLSKLLPRLCDHGVSRCLC